MSERTKGSAIELEGTNPEQIVSEQVEELIKLGFPQELYTGDEKYRESFSSPATGITQPEAYGGRFDIPVLVDPRIVISQQLRLAKITDDIDSNLISNSIKIPERPYVIWTRDPRKWPVGGTSAKEAKGRLKEDEEFGPLIELTSLYIHQPDFFRNVPWVNAMGSGYLFFPFRRIPILYRGRDEGNLDANPADNKVIPFIRGKEIVELVQ